MLHASIFPSFVFFELSLVSETNMPCFEGRNVPFVSLVKIWMPKFQRNTQGALVKRQIFGTPFWRSGAIWAMADDSIS